MLDLNALTLADLFVHLTTDGSLDRLLELARDEDLGTAGDVTTLSVVSAEAQITAHIASRADGVVAGLAVVDHVLRAFDADLSCELHAADGERIKKGAKLATLSGLKRDLLTVERTMLNLISRMSGVATLTRTYVDKIVGTRAAVCETRKTTPGLRSMEKYAARCGGAHLHRLGLHDAILIKDNHLEGVPPADLPGYLAEAVTEARMEHDLRFVEIEVDTIDQLESLLSIPAGVIDIILLDNMSPEVLRQAVALRDAARPGIQLEASGGITLDSIRPIAETGVDRISIGALTHSAVSLDFGLDAD